MTFGRLYCCSISCRNVQISSNFESFWQFYPWNAPIHILVSLSPYLVLIIWSAYLSVLNIFLDLCSWMLFLIAIKVPLPLCWYWGLSLLIYALCLTVLYWSCSLTGSLSSLMPVSMKIPMSSSFSHSFMDFSLCLFIFLDGSPLILAASILS